MLKWLFSPCISQVEFLYLCLAVNVLAKYFSTGEYFMPVLGYVLISVPVLLTIHYVKCKVLKEGDKE